MQESIVFLVRVQRRRKESSRLLSHLLMSLLFFFPVTYAHCQGLDIGYISHNILRLLTLFLNELAVSLQSMVGWLTVTFPPLSPRTSFVH